MWRTRMTTLAFVLSELFALDGFRCNFVSALQLKYPLVNYHDTLQLCRTGHDDMTKKDPGFGFFVKIHLQESSKLNF